MQFRSNAQIGIFFFLILLVLSQLAYLLISNDDDHLTFTVLVGILILLLSIFMGIRRNHQLNPSDTVFLQDVKAGVRPAAIFSMLLAVYAYAFFSAINPEYTENKVETIVQNEKNEVADAGGWVEFKEENQSKNEEIAALTEQEYYDQVKEGAETILNPFIAATATLIFTMMMSIFYALLLTIFYRKVLVKAEQ